MAVPRDSLGFLLPPAAASSGGSLSSPTSHNSAKWAALNIPLLATDASQLPNIDLNIIKDMVRNGGIPSQLRPTMWFWLSGGAATKVGLHGILAHGRMGNRLSLEDVLGGSAVIPSFLVQVSLPPGYYQRLAGSTDDVDDTSAMSIEKGTAALAQPFRHHVVLQSPKVSGKNTVLRSLAQRVIF